MKNILYAFIALSILIAGCGKDDQKPMTDKEFEKMVERYFSGVWMVDDFSNEHESLNEKSHGLKGKISAMYSFNENGGYNFTYDTLVNDHEYTVNESGSWRMDHSNRRLHLYPAGVTITDVDDNEENLPARPSRYYGIRYLSSEKLYFENYYKAWVTSINSEGAEVQQWQDLTETLYFVAEKKC
ncbi:MAG TPA: DUF5004 domain-containing protein [Flavobacteriales bacterium]|nr:DUF5004 domain-containing protein [Flavobacteriales bacterium]